MVLINFHQFSYASQESNALKVLPLYHTTSFWLILLVFMDILEYMSLTYKIAHNAIIQFAGKILGTALGLVTIGMITRYLDREGFGYYTTIMGFLQFFAIMIDFGLTITTAQMLAHNKWGEDKLFANLLSLRIISAIIFLLIGAVASLFFPYPAFVKQGIFLMTLSYFFISLNQIFLGFYQKELKLIYVSLAEVGNRIFLLAGILLVTTLNYGLSGILFAIMISNFLQLLMLYFPARKLQRIYIAIHRQVWKDIWSSTWPIALSIAFNLLYLKTDIIVLSVFRSPEEVGLYGAAYKVVEVLMNFPIIFAGILLPLLTRFWKAQQKQEFAHLIQQGFDAMSLFALPMAVGTIFVASDLMALIAGESFRDSGLLLQLLIFATATIFLGAVFSHAIVALNKQKATIWVYALAAAIGVTGYFIFIPKYGSIAAAAFTVITESIVAVLIFILYCKYSGLRPTFKRWLPALISCGFMGIALWLLRSQPFTIQLLAAVLVYAIALLGTRGISKEFVKEITNLRNVSL